MMLHVSLILLSASACLAQISVPGPCPALGVKEDFDVTKYVGKWYEAAKYPARFEANGKCNTATYTANADGTVQVVNALLSTVTGENQSITGSATFAGSSNEAKLLVTFPTSPSAPRAAPYWVIDTDYTNFAVVYGCEEAGANSYRFSWILTRAQNPSTEVLQQAYGVMDNNNISREDLTVTDQTNC